MPNDNFDKLLAEHFHESSNNKQLDRLEPDVWKAIHFKENEGSTSWYNTILFAFCVPKFQVSSIVFALLIGFVLGPIFVLDSKKELNYSSLDLRVFKITTPYLTTNLIEHTK